MLEMLIRLLRAQLKLAPKQLVELGAIVEIYLVMLAMIGYSRDLYKRILSDYLTTFCYNTSSRVDRIFQWLNYV